MIQLDDISSAEEVDEFLLAAYLSHGLPAELRHEIERHLLRSSEARDLLGMAQDALDGVLNSDIQPGKWATPTDKKFPEHEVPSKIREDEKGISGKKKEVDEKRSADRAFLNMQIGVASIPVLVVIAGLLIWSLFPKTADTPQSQSLSTVLGTMWIPTLDAAGDTISWPIINSATQYAVIVYNPDDRTIVHVATTDKSSLSGIQAFTNIPVKSRPAFLSVWVMALDDQGTAMRSSDSVTLVSKRYEP